MLYSRIKLNEKDMTREEAEEKIIELWRQQIGQSGELPFMVVEYEERKGYISSYKAYIADILSLEENALSFTLGEGRNKIRNIKLESIKRIR